MSGGTKALSTGHRRGPLMAAASALMVLLVAAALIVWTGPGRSDAARPLPTPTPTPTPTVPPGTFSPPPTIPADCSVSVTSQLESWLATIPNGSTIVFLPTACYRIDTIFHVWDRIGLTFEGNGATFRTVTNGTEFPGARNRSHWKVVHSTDIIIRNIVIDGPNSFGIFAPNLEAQHGFEVGGGVRVTISNVVVREVFGDGVRIAKSFGTKAQPLPQRDSEDVLIEGSTFDKIGRQGLSIISARRVTLRGNNLISAQRSAVDIEPISGNNTVEDIVIDSNTFAGYENYMVAAGGACSGTFRNLTIIGNTATGAGPRVGKTGCVRENLIIEGNTITVPPMAAEQGILIVAFTGVVVRDNVVDLGESKPGVDLQAATGTILIESNHFCGASVVYVADPETGPVTEQGNNLAC